MLERLAAGACLCLAGAMAWAQSSGLSGQEIGALVAGATVEIDTPVGTRLPVRYEPDGRMAGEARDLAWYLGAAADTGRWWVAGDELCHKWMRWFDGAPQCMRVSREGRLIRWQSRDGNTGTASIAIPAPAAPRVAQASALVALPRLVSRPAPQAAPPEMQTPAPAAAPAAPPVALPEAVPSPPSARDTSAGVSTSAWSSDSAAASMPSPDGLGDGKPASSPASPPLPPGRSPMPGPAAPAPQRQAAAHPPPAAPEPMPERQAQPTFMVANVRQDDVLNVRSGPSADFDIVGEFAPGSRGIAITSTCRSQWCPVRLDATTGWVNSAYLAPEAPQASPGAPLVGGSAGHHALRDSPEAPRRCLTSAARALLERIEKRFGAVQVISTCRPGAMIAGTGHPSRHASGNAIDFNAGSRKAAIVAWLVATHHTGGTMTYAGMDHIHVDIGPHFVSIAGGPHWASWRDGRRE